MASEGHTTLVSLIRANPLMHVDVDAQRASMDQASTVILPPPEAVIEPADAAGVPVELVTMPSSDPDRWVLYFHSGAYTSGSLNSHRVFATRVADRFGARVCNVDYRLGPEHPYPAAVEDAATAWRWLIGDGIGADPAHSIIAGDSAGGGLAVCAALALLDAGDPLPAALFAISPWADLTLTSESYDSRADADPILSRAILEAHAAHYLAGADPTQRLVSPALADLTGLPPLLIHAGDADILVNDAHALAAQADKAGVDVTLEVGEEMLHCYLLFGGLVPEADEAMARAAAWVRDRVA
jgi:acetyl esterase/lipase